eukprot:1612288-Prymnesium_polylepis.3
MGIHGWTSDAPARWLRRQREPRGEPTGRVPHHDGGVMRVLDGFNDGGNCPRGGRSASALEGHLGHTSRTTELLGEVLSDPRTVHRG